MAATYRKNGVETIVLDPMNDPEWAASFKTTDPDKFLTMVWDSRQCAVFIDEAGKAIGRFNNVMNELATQGRHWGHNVHFITQGGTQLAPIIRNQCSQLFIFTTAKTDCKVHANEWNASELENASLLKVGEYYHATRYGECTKHSLFGETK